MTAQATKNPVTRVTVNLPTSVWDVLSQAAADKGLSKTEAVRRAISMWAFVSEEMRGGAELLLRRPDGTLERVHFVDGDGK